MPPTRTDQSPGGEPGYDGLPPDAQDGHDPAPDPAGDLKRLVEEVRTICAQLATDVSALAKAQWRLTSYVLAGSARIWAARCAALVIAAALALGSWVFLNVAVWRTVSEMMVQPAAPALALFLLNGVVGAILYFWQKGLKLQ